MLVEGFEGVAAGGTGGRQGSTCVATPTGQVLVWHLRIMMQPMVIRGAVAKPNSSAPSSAATARSRPVRSCPSACSTVRPRRSFATSTWCVSARPSSQGSPAAQPPACRSRALGSVHAARVHCTRSCKAQHDWNTRSWSFSFHDNQSLHMQAVLEDMLTPSTQQLKLCRARCEGALPADLMLDHLAAPVPPSWPEINT